MAHAPPVHFTLRAASLGESELEVTRVEGRERLSEPYLFVVTAWSAEGARVDLPAALGGEALLRLRREGLEERVVHGEVHAAELVEVAAGRPLLRFTIRPRLARLGLGARSRVFQEKSAPEIVAAVLEGWSVAHRLDLAGRYPKRDLTLQHRESDLAFVSRLLESEGIWYRFEHAEDRHELVLADAPGAYVRGGAVAYRPHGELAGGTPYVSRVERTARLVPGTTSSRDFDFERPMLEVSGRAREGDGPEVYDWPGGYRVSAEGSRRARTRLEELRHGAETWAGEGTTLVPAPGVTFGLEEHPELLTVGVVHRGEQGRSATGEVKPSYALTFEALDAGRPYRPRRRTPTPRVGLQTATVVVPAGEEIHTERHERVKVRFRWDREGKQDDTASAWVRLAQPWAGAGMGAAFVPRVGQEVLIRFLDGDPDRPLVVGAVYNGENVPPLELPQQKTRSTLRTATSPGSEGYNELRFEDEAGREELHLHAQRDREIEVRADEERVVQGSAALAVTKDRTQQVLGSQTLDVARDDARAVGSSETTTVAFVRTVTVAGSHDERVGAVQTVTVGGAQTVTVAAASAVTIGAAAVLNVGGGYAINVGGAVNELVVGLKASQVGGASAEVVGAHREERVVGDRTSTTGGDALVDVDGAVRFATDKDLTESVQGRVTILVAEGAQTEPEKGTLEGTSSLKLVVGDKVVLAMTNGGEVQLAGKNLTLDGSEIKAKGGTLKKIQPAGVASLAPNVPAVQPGDLAWIEVSMKDDAGLPAAAEPFRVEFPDGTVREGRLGLDGKARVTGPKAGSCKVTFPRLDKGAWRP